MSQGHNCVSILNIPRFRGREGMKRVLVAERSADELHHLSILDAIEDRELTSQRAIARATGLNLAKVNFCLRKLVEKGYVKLKNISDNPNKLKYLYLITPSGIAAKSRLTVEFIKRTAQSYSRAEERVRRNLVEMRKSGARKVAILGKGDVAEILVRLLKQEPGLEVAGMFCSDNGDGTVAGRRLLPLEDLEKHAFDRIVLVEPDDFEQNLRRLEDKGLGGDRIWLLR